VFQIAGAAMWKLGCPIILNRNFFCVRPVTLIKGVPILEPLLKIEKLDHSLTDVTKMVVNNGFLQRFSLHLSISV